jgi:rod shape-determining protein MreD
MKRGLAVLALGLIALGVQGGMAMSIPRPLCPDLGLLVVIAIGLHWREATGGLFLASALGFTADILSTSIFGAHALLRVLVYAATALTRSQMDLRSGAALALFSGGMTILHSLGLISLMQFFGAAGEGPTWSGIGALFPHAAINAIFAPIVSAILLRVCDWAEGEASRPGLEIDATRTAT